MNSASLQSAQNNGRPAVGIADGAANPRLSQRLDELREELRRGTSEMAQLDARRRELQALLLRISGAAQVLEELLEESLAAPNGSESGAERAGRDAPR
jgi:hypothetical protein